MSGQNELAAEFDINSKTAEEALRQLTGEGLLESRGVGKRRRIVHAGDARPPSQRIVRRAENVSRGREDLRQTETPAVFVEGGTIGPAAR